MSKKPLKRVAQLSGIGLQLTVTIFLAAYLGDYLDERYPISEKRLYTLIFTLLGTGIAIYNVIRQLNKVQ